jgi:3-oxoacyl-[acyl-carrier protein] reductase
VIRITVAGTGEDRSSRSPLRHVPLLDAARPPQSRDIFLIVSHPLRGRIALITGVSRRIGIGYAVAARLAALGADVLAHGWSAHDAEQPWGADPAGDAGVVGALRAELSDESGRVEYLASDFARPEAAADAITAAVSLFGGIDILVAAHARSSAQDLAACTAEELDLSWAVNVRGTLLLAQCYAKLRDHSRSGGRIVLFTSGQHHSAMPEEIPYIATKGALQQVTASLASEFAPSRVTVNCVNPGPVDTGYADPELAARVQSAVPLGRWGQPADTANLVEWLVSDSGAWMTGQTLVSDGGAALGSR